MVKKYEIVQRSVRLSSGELVRKIGVAIIEMTCLGERRLDISGYPPMRMQVRPYMKIGLLSAAMENLQLPF